MPGNDRADFLAKAGYNSAVAASALPSLTFIRAQAKKSHENRLTQWWAEVAPERCKVLGLEMYLGCHSEPQSNRSSLHHLLAAQSARGGFAAYHKRVSHDDAKRECSCGWQKILDQPCLLLQAYSIRKETAARPLLRHPDRRAALA